MTEQAGQTPAFGTFSPPSIVQRAITLCHNETAPLLSRLLAPFVRKYVIKLGTLPLDIRVGGFRLRCTFTDNYSEKKFVFTPWRYDVEERQLIKNWLPQNGVFIDIGANVGLYVLTASQVLGQEGRIIAFEPNPETMKRLEFHLDENRNSGLISCQLTLQELGIADHESEFQLTLDSRNLGASSVRPKKRKVNPKDPVPKTIAVRCRPLVDVLKENGITKVDCLKIDIEGAEDLALAPFFESADQSLFPEILIIENSESSWACDLFGLITRSGYRLLFRNKMNSAYAKASPIARNESVA